MKQLKFTIAVTVLVLVFSILAIMLSEYKIENANLVQTIEVQETEYAELESTATHDIKMLEEREQYFLDLYRTEIVKPTQTPWVITATPEPTFIPTATTNPAWISIWITQNTRAYEFSGRYNGNGDMILDITEIILLQGKELLVHKNRIQVDGMRVYQIIGPVAIGLYVPIDHTTK